MNDFEKGIMLAELCADKAGDPFKESAYEYFVSFAKTHETLTTSQVRKAYVLTDLPQTHDGRAWGHVATKARKAGVVYDTGEVLRTGSHARHDTLWRSLIYEGE